MDKYEVYVKVTNKPREMFRIRVDDMREIIDEVNDRYNNIIECTACKLFENKREYKSFNIDKGKVIS